MSYPVFSRDVVVSIYTARKHGQAQVDDIQDALGLMLGRNLGTIEMDRQAFDACRPQLVAMHSWLATMEGVPSQDDFVTVPRPVGSRRRLSSMHIVGVVVTATAVLAAVIMVGAALP